MRVTMNGYSLAVEDGGQGTPVLLLHGFPISSAAFSPIRAFIEEVGRLVTVDLRGFGASDAPPGPYDMDSLADDVVRIADHLGLERFVLGGHSMGGYVAFRVAANHRHRLSGLILIDTRAAADTAEGVERRRAAVATIAGGGRDAFLGAFLPLLVSPATQDRQPEVMELLRAIAAGIPNHVLTGCLEGMMTRPDSRGLLAGLDLPALVVHGADDAVMPLDEARALALALPRGQLVEVPDAGHTPTLEQPQLVGEAIARLLAEQL
ncbi:MAG: alpha/beta hydrolase [Holophagae bacterium]|nr:MAG: alpha/beta hydrolase [Holophagae bacterium]